MAFLSTIQGGRLVVCLIELAIGGLLRNLLERNGLIYPVLAPGMRWRRRDSGWAFWRAGRFGRGHIGHGPVPRRTVRTVWFRLGLAGLLPAARSFVHVPTPFRLFRRAHATAK